MEFKMCNYIPITLTGDTLGERHREINSLVNEAYKSGLPFHSLQNLSEKSPVDRLFKIDLASKLKNVDYILQNIKDDDLLYVSRALKSVWILDTEYQNIINPIYLENSLFPNMLTTSVGKFKNWLYVNLKDPVRCEQIYRYYVEKDIDYSIKFLNKCNNVFIVKEAGNFLEKLSPQRLKILSEKCPEVTKMFYENISSNEKIKNTFLENDKKYFESLKVILKRDPNIFFDISEKYFDKKFNKRLTKFILSEHKYVFNRKIELYASRLLNMETLAECLSIEECKEIVLQLARAKYLSNWFSYKKVEPLIKRLPADERAGFKKRVFVDRDIGKEIEKWLYEIPCLPTKDNKYHVFDDIERDPDMYEQLGNTRIKILKNITKRKKKRYIEERCCDSECIVTCSTKTYLDKLFDEYRFMSFGKTIFELRKRIKAESSPMNREYILLVLVSKSGGRPENLATLLELLSQHTNEPVHVRAAIVRSLVKRAAVWRLPQETWEDLLKFGQGLGLDGSTPECECREGLHAVVLRNLLETEICEPKLRDAFLENFSQLDEYSTNSNERKILKNCLPLLIQNAAEAEVNTEKQAEILSLLLDTLELYKVRIDESPLIPAVKDLAKRDFTAAEYLLRRLFYAKICRRTLFFENFSFIQTDDSYLNALRHDKSVLDLNILLNDMITRKFCPNRFLQKIGIYFSENAGLKEIYLKEMKEKVATLTSSNFKLAKAMSLLLGADLTYICGLNVREKHIARFAAELRANMHTGRTKLDIKKIDLTILGAKAIANKTLVCRDTEVDEYIELCLKFKATVKLGLLLSQRICKEVDSFKTAASLKPIATLKTAIKYFRRKGDAINERVWDVVKPLLQNIDFSTENRKYLHKFITKINDIPSSIKLEYCIILYKTLLESFYYKALSMLCHIELQFPKVSQEFIENELTQFLNEMNTEKYYRYHQCALLYVRILIKYLLIAKTEDIQKERFAVFGEKLLNNLEYTKNKNGRLFEEIYDEILLTLQNNKIFFDNSTVSPLYVMEAIVPWMHKNFPIELYFRKYVYIHLIMLYYKTIRQCLIQMPEIFSNEKLKRNEGVDIVGVTFGKYIGHESKNLISQYFDSITELYRNNFQDYFDTYFQQDSTKSTFIAAVIKGILKSSKGPESKIGVYLLNDKSYSINKDIYFQLADEMKKIEDLETKFFVFAELDS